MKAVIAIDSLKGSLSSMEAGYAIADGIRKVHGQEAEIVVRPLADGGEGTVEALVSGMNGVTQNVMVTGPLGTPVNCEYGIIESSHTAVIEMSGAAGGLGFAFLSFTNAVLESGIKIVLEETGLEKYMENADIVITGEGRLDGQTAMGKAPVGAARLAKKHDIPVIAFAGSVTKEAVACNQNGIDAFFPILRGVVTLEEAMKPENAKANMTDTVEQVFRLLKTAEKNG